MSKIRYFGVFAGIVLAAFLLAPEARAQNPSNYYEEEPRTFYGGVILGANFSQIDGDRYAGYYKTGLNAGGILYTQLAEHLAASLEILFSQKGARSRAVDVKASNTNPQYIINSYKATLSYIEVPLQLNYFDRRKSHFGAGFSYSRLISGDERVDITQPRPISSDTLLNYPFRKSDFMFVLGGSLHIVKGLFLNLRFQYSLAPIRSNEETFEVLRSSRPQYNNMYTLRLMYLF